MEKPEQIQFEVESARPGVNTIYWEQYAKELEKYVDHLENIAGGYTEEQVRTIALKFFFNWYNAKGTNTEEHFDRWWPEFKQQFTPNNTNDSKLLDWLQTMMTDDDNYCEIFFAGLRNGTGKAETFQVESNPQKFETVDAETLREAIKLAMEQDGVLHSVQE